MDFKKASELFSDKEFDGEPEIIYEPGPNNPPYPPIEPEPPIDTEPDINRRIKYVVGNVTVYVMAERVQYYGAQGKLITESLKDYTKQTIKKGFTSLDDFLKKWNSSDRKTIIIEELRQLGVLLEPLSDEVGRNFDAFDLICHIVYDQPPLTRRERAEKVKKKNYFSKYNEQARKILENLLEKYSNTSIEHIEDINILTVTPFNSLGTPVELISAFGDKLAYTKAVQELGREIYA